MLTNQYGDIFIRDERVCKMSGKPFKNREKEDEIEYFGVNPQDPKKSAAVFLKGSRTWVNIDKLKHTDNARN